MDARFIALGVSLLMVSVGFTIYGIISGLDMLTGVALSTAVLGGTLAVIGVTYRDPFTEAVRVYSDVLSSPLVKIVEDLGLLSKGVVQSCVDEGRVYVLLAEKPVRPCRGLAPGLGFNGESVYLSFLLQYPSYEGLELDELLMNQGLAQLADVKRGGGSILVELRGLRRELLREEWRPINPYRLLVPAYASALYGWNYIVSREEWSEDHYRAELRVLEGAGAS